MNDGYLEDLKRKITDEQAFLNKYEEKLALEDDPRRKAALQAEIEDIKFKLFGMRAKLHELQVGLEPAKQVCIQRQKKLVPLQNWSQEIRVGHDIGKESLLTQTELSKLLNRDPFLYDQAEDEETSLFTDDGFWFGHPAYRAVETAGRIQVVSGSPGCGRTALAKGLCFNESRWSRFFWHYQRVYPGLTDKSLSEYLAEQLLQYIFDKPTLLVSVGEKEWGLVTAVLISALPKQVILARIERVKEKRTWHRATMTKGQREVWQQVGEEQLSLLLQTVESHNDNIPVNTTQWAMALDSSFQALGFRGVRLVLDCMRGMAEFITTLLPTLQTWQQSGLVSTLFVSENAGLTMLGLPEVPLQWSRVQLERLFTHRLLRLSGSSIPPYALFASTAVYNSFMDAASYAPATPRRLTQLWQAALANMGKLEAIDEGVLQKAVEAVRARDAEAKAAETTGKQIDLGRLQSLIDESFNDNEVRDLCLDLDVDYDNLGGGNKKGKIRELVLLLNRTGRVPDLLVRCRALRPLINWG